MAEPIFIGREAEFESLNFVYQREKPSLVVIKGRRRIGKSRLVLEFAKTVRKHRFLSFAGLAPAEGISAQAQRDYFARQLSLTLRLPPQVFEDWTDAWEYLSLHLQPGDIVLFDEISWMGSQDPTFIPKLKAWWDKQTLHVLLVCCGSVSTWIEDNILNSTAFFGRVNLTISLKPLSIPESAEFLRTLGMRLSAYDQYKLLSIAGGVPWYLEQFNPKITADENIKQLAFEKDGLLVTEFDRIFHDLFNGKGSTRLFSKPGILVSGQEEINEEPECTESVHEDSEFIFDEPREQKTRFPKKSMYKRILYNLTDGAKTLANLQQAIEEDEGPAPKNLGQMLEHLSVAGFVQKESLWSFKTTQPLKQSLYRIADPYMRFYFKQIAPNAAAIASGELNAVPLSSFPGFDTHMGLQLEALLLQNRSLLIQKIGVSPIDIVRSGGPYRQNQTSAQKGCQIDYLVQTRTHTLFIFEFKFKRREIHADIIKDMQEKIARLKAPKGFAKVPVLCHIGGVSAAVETSDYFYRIIDIMDFLEMDKQS